MMLFDIAIGVIALAFAVLVAYLVPTLIQLRKTVAESQVLVANLNAEVPELVKRLRGVAEDVETITNEARDGVAHASVLLHAVGEVGESVRQVHALMRGKTVNFLVKAASMFAGLRAASGVVKERVHKDEHEHEFAQAKGGEDNGKR